MLTVILTGLGSRFSRPVHGYFNGLGVRGDLRRGRGHGNRQREALPWKNNYFRIFFLPFSSFQSMIETKVFAAEMWLADP